MEKGIPAHQMGVENPTWECNAAVYNNEGCCQSIVSLPTRRDAGNSLIATNLEKNYTNPSTNQPLYLCSLSIGT